MDEATIRQIIGKQVGLIGINDDDPFDSWLDSLDIAFVLMGIEDAIYERQIIRADKKAVIEYCVGLYVSPGKLTINSVTKYVNNIIAMYGVA